MPMTMSVSPRPACPDPLRFWDGDRLAAVHDRRIWHRWGGRWVNYLFAEGSAPFTDAQARALMWHRDEPDAVDFRPRVPAANLPLPGSAVAARHTAGLVLEPALSVTPYLLSPAAHRGGVHHFQPAHDLLEQIGAQPEQATPEPPAQTNTVHTVRRALRLLLLDREQPASVSYHRPAGRLYARQSSQLGVTTFVWILNRSAAASH